jgi:photosystem II stability/assembly factor-like uncharacterized protein
MTPKRTWMTAAAAGLLLAGSGTAAATAALAAAAATAATAGSGVPGAGPVPAGFQPISATFISASDGWVLGTAPCTHRPCTSVVRTTDGGRHWAGIPAPRYVLSVFPGNRGLDRIRFADTRDGFAFGSQLWATHNGGRTWHHVSQLPGYVVDLETSAGVVYAASEKSNSITIYRSRAGRDAWTRVGALPTVRNSYGGLGTITLHGAAGWIILGNRLYSSPTGAHWTRDSVRCPAEWGMDSVGSYSTSRITLLCVGNPGLGQTQKTLYASANGGATFTRVGPVPSGGDGGLLAEPATRHLFVATSSAATWIYVSANGGRTWRSALTLDDGGKGWSDFGFTTARQGLAVEGTPSMGSRLYLTWNAGRSWHPVQF